MPRYKFEEIAVNSTAKKKPTHEDKDTYLGLEHIDSGCLHISRFGTEVAPIGEKLLMKKGDVLFGKRRAYQKKVAIAPFDGIFSAHGMVLRPREDVITQEFFPLFISSDYFLDAAISISVGSLSPTINWGALKELEFDLPDIATQGKLARLLWAAIETKNAYRHLIFLTDSIVKSQFIEMLSAANLTDDDYVALETICNRPPQNGIYKKDIGEHPNAKIAKMKQLFTDKPICAESNLDGIFLTEKELASFQLTSNDLVFGRRSLVEEGAGKCSLVGNIAGAFVFESSLLRITLDIRKALPIWIYYWFNSDEGKAAIKRIRNVVTIAGIKGSDLRKVRVPIVSIDLQNQFARFVEQADKSKFALQNTLEKLEATYKGLLNKHLG